MSHTDIVVCGIDPGLKGAFSFLNITDGTLKVISMPTYKTNSGKTHIDPKEVSSILHNEHFTHACIEQVHSSPQMGVTSAFSFGRSFGGLLFSCHMKGVEVKEVTPSVWKPAIGCTADKSQTVDRANTLFPNCGILWKKVKDTDKAEASLLALYGAVRFGFTVPKNIIPIIPD